MGPWRAILRYHGAFLEELEQGHRDWSDQKSDLKEGYLYPYSRNSVYGKSESVENVRFCYDYHNKTQLCSKEMQVQTYLQTVLYYVWKVGISSRK